MIDGHAHACGRFLKSENIIEELDRAGVSQVVLVPGEPDSSKNYPLINVAKLLPLRNVVKITNEISRYIVGFTGAVKSIPQGNEYVYSICKETNGRAIQFIWITQDIEDIGLYLDNKYDEWKFQGVKLHQCWEKFVIDSPYFQEVAQWAEDNDLPLFIHLYSDKDVKDLIAYKQRHPKLRLIIAHLFGLELVIAHHYQDKNLYFDISPYQLVSDKRLLKAINFVKADHLLMGSDTPYGHASLEKGIDRIKNLDISAEDKKLILGENMKLLLKIQS